jgi:MoaA/NifB/PqqE/SkfB family radical SAM enzyme
MKEQAKNIKEIYFAGGEPTLIPEHYKILEFMVESGNAKECVIRYNSNGLELPDNLFSLWHHFKGVRYNISIDAVGEKNDYIRYPSKWDNLITSLKKLDNTEDHITVNIACAVQLLNILYLDELAQWKIDQKFKKINLAPYGGGVIGMHLVTFPSYLNIRVLPKNLKILASKKIQKFLDLYTTEEFVNLNYGKLRWEGMVNYMLAEDWSNKLPSTIEYLESCDKIRKTNFRDIFKDLTI